ncbi:hypothetical protein NDU88_001713 [Pleurodeles waltl]|uniref:Uncharacterized protein n=1 Tax=Pleurodeles waltl TaxID=8319 RepID=A0AAV7P4S5_PLEWA|nr:hypothetical protein NDU88_001713 [Pleurodeles waltl]
MVGASVSPLHTRTCDVIFHAGKSCVVFRCADSLLLWFAGLPDVAGSVRGNLGSFSGCASFRWAVRGIFSLTAGVTSISSLKSGGVVQARPCVEVPVRPQALRRAVSFRIGVR